jgi:hypothetical protein
MRAKQATPHARLLQKSLVTSIGLAEHAALSNNMIHALCLNWGGTTFRFLDRAAHQHTFVVTNLAKSGVIDPIISILFPLLRSSTNT